MQNNPLLNQLSFVKDKVIEDKTKKIKTGKYGNYTEIIKDIEAEFFSTIYNNNKTVCHFYHKDFEGCKIIDKHLQIIAQSHSETLFVKIDAEKSPFLTQKYSVLVFPTIILFIRDIAFHRFKGLQDFGMNDDFPTINLARQLVIYKMIEGKTEAERGEMTTKKK